MVGPFRPSAPAAHLREDCREERRARRAAALFAFALAVGHGALSAGDLSPPPLDLAGLEPRVAEQIEAARARVARSPASPAAWGALGMSLDVHGLEDEAIPCYEEAAARDPEEIRWPYYLALLYHRRGAPESLGWYARSWSLAPEYGPLLVRYGDALGEAGRSEEAAAAYRRARSVSAMAAPAQLRLARMASARGQLEEAVAWARGAIESAPRLGEARRLLADLYRRQGKADLAQRQRSLAAALPAQQELVDPLYGELVAAGVSSYWHRMRGRAALQQGEPERAVEELTQALALAPSAEAHDTLGLALQQLGRPTSAVEHHRRALSLRSGWPQAWSHLASALFDAGQPEEAVAAAQRAIALDPAVPEAWLDLGTFLQADGRAAPAMDAFRRGLEVAPGDLRLTSRLAWLLATASPAELRDGAEAVRLAAAVCETTAYRLPEALDVLAAAYAENGQPARALAIAGRALELARTQGDEELARQIESRLQAYREQR